MDKQLLQDTNELGQLLDKARDFALLFREDTSWPVASPLTHVPVSLLPDWGAGAQDAMDLFQEQWKPYLVASPSPRYLGFVTGGATPAALLGDWLSGAADQNPQSVTGFGDVSAAIEQSTIGLLRQLFGDRGTYFLTPTSLNGTRGLRAAFVNWQNSPAQVPEIMAELRASLFVLSSVPAAAP
jgi:hypothetical protein